MNEQTLNDFLSSFDNRCYPEAFLNTYELMECLANNPMGETLLVQDHSGNDYIAKCYTNQALLSKTTENELLKRLHHIGLPEYVEEFQNENMLCVVRQYAKGVPLNRLEKPLAESQVISIGLQLCDILSYLHGQTPPVIHRDIKPQNIVMDDDGKITLIDFGISRLYDENARADTVFFGTQEFAPPEQYGFSQTDNRTDIFSLGVVLRWLLTSRTSLKAARIKNRRLERIVCKCTAFAPQDRFRTAKAVKKALQNADAHREKKALRVCCAVLALLAALTVGFAAGRFTEVRPALFYNNSYAIFSDPLVERAVRLQLGKTEDETITSEELDQVTELHLYADQTVKTVEEFYTLRGQVDSGAIIAGVETISTFDDIVKLRNLQSLSLGRQSFTDISAISGLGGLVSLRFSGCPVENIEALSALSKLEHFTLDNCDSVTDISPLSGCPNISELVMTGCRADDFSVLSQFYEFECLHLQGVDTEKFLPYLQGKTIRQFKIGFTPLASISELDGIEGMEELMLVDLELSSLEGIENMETLRSITIQNMPWLNLEPLASLPYLATVTVSEDMRDAAAVLDGKNIEIKYQ